MVLSESNRIVIAKGAEIEPEHLEAHTIVVRGTVNGRVNRLGPGATARVKGCSRYDVVSASQLGVRIGCIEGPQDTGG